MFFMSYQLVCLLTNILMAFLHSLLICVLFLKVALAEKTAVLFTKDGDQHNNLYDMQCMWYISLLD